MNAVEIARILIDAGSEVDATCNAYGGSTAMGLLVTSEHPAESGVQVALVETLLDAGAAIDGAPTDKATPIEAALGYPDAAEADRANVRAVLEVKNIYGGTVLDGTVCGARNVKRHVDRLPVIRKLIAAGAKIEGVGPRPVDIPAIEALLAAGAATK